MLSICLSENQAEFLDRALQHLQRVELADAAARANKNARAAHLERARKIAVLRIALDSALPEPDHR